MILRITFTVAIALAGVPSQAGGMDSEKPYSLGSVDAYYERPLSERAFVFRNMMELEPYPVRWIRHGDQPIPLPTGKPIEIGTTIDGKQTDLATFMADNQVAAMLIIQKGKVVFERYRMGNRPDSRWVMFSVSKSVTSMLVGAALRDGAIAHIDDLIVRYLPSLNASAWDGVTVRDALRMSSGIELHDVYESKNGTGLGAAYVDPAPGAPLRYLATIKRSSPPGTHFSYSGANSYVLGQVVTAATGKRLSDYLSEKIWRPMGMEDDAYWRLDSDGQEVAQGGLSATLRDMGRFGLLALHGGYIVGKRIVPDDWFAQATAVDTPAYLRPGAIKGFEPMGYGYQWWTIPSSSSTDARGGRGIFAAIGIYGQQIYIVPNKDMVVVIQSAAAVPVPMKEVMHAQAVLEALPPVP